jgi:cbb3-type cytochrome oxidase maturation protein
LQSAPDLISTFTFVAINYMSALFILIGISIVVAGSFLAAFLWSVSRGQYDDDYTPSVRMLFDDVPESAAAAEKASH